MNEQVRVRVVDLRGEPDMRLLSERERARAQEIRSEAGRRRFARTRAALREWLAELSGEEPGALEIHVDGSGKPHLASSDLRFSVSHSDQLGVIAVTVGCELGIDVEHVRERPRLGAIAGRFLGAREAAAIARASDPVRAFHEAWTRHEALAKALGTGLPLPERLSAGCAVVTFEPALEYVAAVALAAASLEVVAEPRE